MSVVIQGQVFDLDPAIIGPTDALVLLALADSADSNDATTWIPIQRKKQGERRDGGPKQDLRRKTKLGVRAIQLALRRLEKAGHLTREERPGKGVLYTIHPNPNPTSLDEPDDLVTQAVKAARGESNAGRTRFGPHDDDERGAPDSPKPSVTVIDIGGVAPRSGSPVEMIVRDRQDFLAAWGRFRAMRRVIRKPLNETAIARLFGSLVKLQAQGHDPMEVVEQSTANCWQGFWPIKDEDGGDGDHGGRSNGGGERFGNPMVGAAADALRRESFGGRDRAGPE
jgi:DNA-binding transcriptional ArsR family regulator